MSAPRPTEDGRSSVPGDAPLRRASWIARHLPSLLALTVLALVAYSNTFAAEFVFDDEPWIVRNPVIQDLRNYLLDRAGYDQHQNRYLANLTLALNYALGGLDPRGYHAFNVAIHAANALLVYALTLLLFRTPLVAASRLARSSRGLALAASALFVAHPLQTQAVTYVVQRLTSLVTTFYLLAAVLYLAWRVRSAAAPRSALRTTAAYGGVLAVTVAAMRTKEVAFTLPFALAACELWFFPISRRSFARLLPLAATLPIIPATLFDLGRPIQELGEQMETPIPQVTLGLGDYLVTQLAAVTSYVRLLVLPIGQNVDHDYPAYGSLLEPRILLAVAVIGALLAVAWLAWRRSSLGGGGDAAWRVVSFGIVWFFLAVSLESVVPLPDVMFEHRAYLPSVGFFVALVSGLALVAEARLRGPASRAVTAAAVAVPLVLAGATFHRNGAWATRVSLWTDAVAKSPDKLRPHYNLGEALAAAGDVDGAIEQYLLALRIAPLHPESNNNLATQYYQRGRVDEAIAHLRTAIAAKPDYAEAHLNLGIAYGDKGWLDLATQEMSLGMRLQATAKRKP